MDAADARVMDAVADFLGTDPWVFLGLTVVLFGAAAYMTGQALAQTWRPAWHVAPYALLLAGGSRFLSYALFDGDLLSVGGAAIAWIVLIAIAFVAFRLNLAQMMVRQYPWLFERQGPLGWREKGP